MPVNLNPDLFAKYSFDVVGIVIIVLLGILAYWLVRRGINVLVEKRYLSESHRLPLLAVFRWIVAILVILLSLQQVGIDMTNIWAALSAFVVLFGVGFIAVWSVISNVLCSILLMIVKPFHIGDTIEVIEATGGAGLRGKVVNLNLLYTFLAEEEDNKTDGAIVYVPNNIFFQKTIRRWQGPQTQGLNEKMVEDKPRLATRPAVMPQ